MANIFKKLAGALFGQAGFVGIGSKIGTPRFHSFYGGGIGNLGVGYLGDGSKYFRGLSSTGASPILDHMLLRQNARSAYHDTPIAKAMVDRFADTVVDVGLRAAPVPNPKILGITPEAAEEWAQDVGDRFHLWAKSKKATRAENMTFYQSQRLVEIFQQRDNDYYARFYYGTDPRLPSPLQIGFVDPNQIRGSSFTSTYGSSYTFTYGSSYTSTYGFQDARDGINRDKGGKEISYDIYNRDDKGAWQPTTVPAVGASGRIHFIHGYCQEYASQGRGYSRLSHALQEFENLTDFTLSQIKKAIAQSAITMYVKPSTDNPASNPMEDMSRQFEPDTEEATATETLLGGDALKYKEMPEVNLRPGSAAVFNLMEGEDLKSFDGNAPSDSFETFTNAFLAHLAASVSMPVEVLLLKFNSNYSASRAALIMFWRVALIWRGELASDFLNPVYISWLSEEIAAGRISAPGFSDPILREAWTDCDWIGTSMPDIDPNKTASAREKNTKLGLTTLDRAAREANGSNGAANRAQLTREYKELPLQPWAGRGGSGGGESKDEFVKPDTDTKEEK